MRIVWDRDGGEARFCGKVFVITSDVRNELNGKRRLHDKQEVVNIVTAEGKYGEAYMPRPFPRGVWKITAVEESRNPVFAPYKIKTNAHQTVDVWTLDANGGYDKKSGKSAEDYGYYLHWSEFSRTTLGCGRVGNDTSYQVILLVELIKAAWNEKTAVLLEVVGGEAAAPQCTEYSVQSTVKDF
jgi:hypothetical protein